MRIIDCIQTSPEWWEAKKGLPSSSSFDRIMTPTKCQPSSQQDAYLCELIAESAMLLPAYLSTRGVWRGTEAMQAGVETEPEARRWYEMEVNETVREVGVCISDCGRFCASPDGLVGEDGVLELKAPLLATQAGYLLKGGLPTDYKCQVHGQLIVTRRKWVDFVSYCPGLPPLMVRVTPDEFTEKLEAELERFLTKYHDAAAKLGVMLTKADGELLAAPAEVF